MKKVSSLLLVVIIMLSSCKKNADNPGNSLNGTFSSDSVTMFGGKAKTWIQFSNGVPQQVAISINDAAMNSLPTDGDEIEIPLTLPAKAMGATAINHAVIDWNPHGHPPIGVYSFPHFDFHFYMMSSEDRLRIPEYEEDSAGFQRYPMPAELPANYVPIPGGEAQMGKHWVDVTSPEMNGAPFTQTFIYGTYNERVTFYEPMVTKAFLDTTTSFERSIPQPTFCVVHSSYPTKMKVSKHDGVTDIILSDFVAGGRTD